MKVATFIALAAMASMGACAGTTTETPQLIAAQSFEVSWTGLDTAAKAVQTAVTLGKVTPGSASALKLAADLKAASSGLAAADDARLAVGNGSDPTVDIAAATAALADISTILGSE